jgi:hypothetical protein
MDGYSDSDEELVVDLTATAESLGATPGGIDNEERRNDRQTVLAQSPDTRRTRKAKRHKLSGKQRPNSLQTKPSQVDLSSVWPGNIDLGDNNAGDAAAAASMFSSNLMAFDMGSSTKGRKSNSRSSNNNTTSNNNNTIANSNNNNGGSSNSNSNGSSNNVHAPAQPNQSAAHRFEATKGMYTLESKDHTWQRMGRVESPKERPATRRDILALHAYFGVAMDLSDRMIRRNNAAGNGENRSGNKVTSLQSSSEMELEQDALAVKEDVRQLFAKFEDLAAAASSVNR